MKKILLVANTAHHLYTQMHLLEAFRKDKYEVVVCCPEDLNYLQKMKDLGYAHVGIDVDGKGKNIFKDLGLIHSFYKIFRTIKPDIILSFTIKPNLYGAFITKLVRIPFIPNITGLGNAFSSETIFSKFVLFLYKVSFSHLKNVFVQNYDDLKLLQDKNAFAKATAVTRLPGSGVNVSKYYSSDLQQSAPNSDAVVFLYSGRLLWNKGVGDLVDAFRIVKSKYPDAVLRIAGGYFFASSSAIMPEQIKQWEMELNIEYLGMLDDVRSAIADATCVVLPSYYKEGVPRAILEASSMARPIITTNSTGCRDVVDDQVTGFLCKPRDAEDLANKMIDMIKIGSQNRKKMGQHGRRKMEREFDQQIVINQYISIVKHVLSA